MLILHTRVSTEGMVVMGLVEEGKEVLAVMDLKEMETQDNRD